MLSDTPQLGTRCGVFTNGGFLDQIAEETSLNSDDN